VRTVPAARKGGDVDHESIPTEVRHEQALRLLLRAAIHEWRAYVRELENVPCDADAADIIWLERKEQMLIERSHNASQRSRSLGDLDTSDDFADTITDVLICAGRLYRARGGPGISRLLP
jgi:inactivated superfamily I helicase